LTAGLLAPALWALLAGAARFDKLPDWAAAVARETEALPFPADADAWVLLQRTDLVYGGEGKVQARVQRVVRILGERGLRERSLLAPGLAGKGSKLKRLKGWNARPDGDLEEIARDDVVTLEDGQARLDTAAFARAMKGSVLAFELVIETEHPMGPVEVLPVVEAEPVRQWSLTTRSERPDVEVSVDAQHVLPWLAQGPAPALGSVSFSDVPARPRDEEAAPADRNSLPWVQVRFHDPSLHKDVPSSATWDTLASWTYAKYATKLAPVRQSRGGDDPRGVLKAIHDWTAAEMVYRQVYLTPERGWIPMPADEVARRRYGDCKDLATLVISEARAAGLQAYPVLARVSEGWVEEAEPPGMFAFNHVIAAVRLKATLGLPAEVEGPQGRFLLVDPTARFTAFGQLTDAHAGRRLLVCTEKGGVWITVPESATQGARTSLRLEGRIVKPWTFEGTLEVSEEGSPEGLRAAEVEGGVEALRKACLRFGLSADARCEVKEHADPFRLDVPYTVVFGLEYKDAVSTAGSGEWTLDLPGVPRPPRSIARVGRARVLPVVFDERGSLDLEVHLRAPWRLSAVTPAERGETAFRAYEWETIVSPVDEGSELLFRYRQQLRPRTFGFDERDEGVAAWKKDRTAVRRLRDAALALKVD
jgi:transglutaminase-like putative cysteine protease